MYEFDIKYSKETIRAITRIQANVFCRKQMLALFASGLFLIAASAVFLEDGKLFGGLLAVGCWLCISIYYPSQYLARQISRGMNGRETEFVYCFGENGIEIRNGQDRNQISYGQIQKIVDAKDGLCCFLSKTAGFLIPKTEFESKAACGEFRYFLERKTGIPAEKEIPVLLRFLCFRLQKKRKGNV